MSSSKQEKVRLCPFYQLGLCTLKNCPLSHGQDECQTLLEDKAGGDFVRECNNNPDVSTGAISKRRINAFTTTTCTNQCNNLEAACKTKRTGGLESVQAEDLFRELPLVMKKTHSTKKTVQPPRQLRRPTEFVKKFFCYSCKKEMPYLFRDSQCLYCQGGFVEETESAIMFNQENEEAEQGLNRVMNALVIDEKSNPKKFHCHGCNKVVQKKGGDVIQCTGCQSYCIEQIADTYANIAAPQGVLEQSNGRNSNTFSGGSNVSLGNQVTKDCMIEMMIQNKETVFKTGTEFIEEVTAVKGDCQGLEEALKECYNGTETLIERLKAKFGNNFFLQSSSYCQEPFEVVKSRHCQNWSVADLRRKALNNMRDIGNRLEAKEAFDDVIDDATEALNFLHALSKKSSSALSKLPSYNMHLLRAAFYIRCGSLLEALDDVSKAVDFIEKKPLAFQMRAMIFNIQGRKELAVLDVRRAVNLDPSIAMPLLNE